MSIVLVKTNSVGTASPYTISAASQGNVLILYFAGIRAAGARTISSIATTNVTWSKVAGTSSATNGLDTEIWMGNVTGTSGTTITLTMSGTSSTMAMIALEFSGVQAVLDGAGATNTNTSTSATNGAYSTTRTSQLVVGCVGLPNGTAPTGNPASPWNATTFANNSTTVGVQGNYINLAAATGAQSATWTIGSALWITAIGGLKASVPTNDWGLEPDLIYDRKDAVPYG